MKYLQKLGKAIMLPVACLPLCGILMGVGYLLCPASMQGGEMTGVLPMIGMFLVKAGGALIDNIAVLFAVGVGVGMADERDGTPAIAALASWLMITMLLKPDNVKPILECQNREPFHRYSVGSHRSLELQPLQRHIAS